MLFFCFTFVCKWARWYLILGISKTGIFALMKVGLALFWVSHFLQCETSLKVSGVTWLSVHSCFSEGPPDWSPEGERLRWVSQSSAGLNMTVSCWRMRTLSRVSFRTLRSQHGSLASGQVRTDTVPQRCLTTLPSPGSWTSELSHFSHRDLYRLSVTEPDRFWGAAATDRLRWMEPFHQVRDCELSSGKISWFLGGKLSVSGEKLFRK